MGSTDAKSALSESRSRVNSADTHSRPKADIIADVIAAKENDIKMRGITEASGDTLLKE